MGRHTANHMPTVVAEAQGATRVVHGKTIVDNASVVVPRGNIVLLTGQSGSGKSTLLRMMGGIVDPDLGKVEIMGQDPAGLKRRDRKSLISSHVGLGFQMPEPHTNFSVRDNFYGLARSIGQKVDHQYAAHVLMTFGLANKLDQKSGDLSGGETLRLGIGRALITKPDVVLLDEPTAALDGAAKETVMHDIATLCHEIGAAALIVTHEVDTARPVADREYIMESGHVVDMLHYSMPSMDAVY